MEEVSWVAKLVGLLVVVGIFAVLVFTAKKAKNKSQST